MRRSDYSCSQTDSIKGMADSVHLGGRNISYSISIIWVSEHEDCLPESLVSEMILVLGLSFTQCFYEEKGIGIPRN